MGSAYDDELWYSQQAKRRQMKADGKLCPKCEEVKEEWWSYCAMCGYHIASGAMSVRGRQGDWQ